MSYDLAIFDPSMAPLDRSEFFAWFEECTEWKEPHNYDDPKVSTPALRAWFLEMITTFPALNGPYAKAELPEDEASVADYSIGESLIYAAFAWTKAEEAYEHMFRLAEKHGVGFFNVSSDTSDVWLPGADGKLILTHSD